MLERQGGSSSPADFRRLLTFLPVVVYVSALCEIHGELTSPDHSARLYAYQSAPGVVVVGIKLGLFLLFLKNLMESYERETAENLRSSLRCPKAALNEHTMRPPIRNPNAHRFATTSANRSLAIREPESPKSPPTDPVCPLRPSQPILLVASSANCYELAANCSESSR